MKKYITQALISICIIFSLETLGYTAVLAVKQLRVLDITIVFSLLISSVAAVILQLICFTPLIFKNLKYFIRVIIFSAALCAVLIVIAIKFKWIPFLSADVIFNFIMIFFGILVIMSVIFSAIYNKKNKEYDGLLGSYKKGITSDGSLPKMLRSSIGIPYDTPLIYPTAIAAMQAVSKYCDAEGLKYSFTSDTTVEIEGEPYDVLVRMAGRFGYTITIRRK